jgi:hypothetical protein
MKTKILAILSLFHFSIFSEYVPVPGKISLCQIDVNNHFLNVFFSRKKNHLLLPSIYNETMLHKQKKN